MRISLDNGETFIDAPNGVHIVYDDVFVPGEDETGEFHVNFTEQNLVADVYVNRGDEDHNIGSSTQTVEETIKALVESDQLTPGSEES